MSLSIKLLEDRHTLELPLSTSYSIYNGTGTFDIVYQDAKYTLVLDVSDLPGDIYAVHVIIGNKQLDSTSSPFEKQDKGKYSFICTKATFDMIYGITDITVEIEFYDQNPQYLFSGHLAVAIDQRYEQTMDSIREMLDDIYKKDHTLLYKGKIRNTNNLAKFLSSSSDKYEQQISILKSILQTYSDNFPYFMQSPNFKSKLGYQIDYVEKLRTMGSTSLRYVATHPEQLKSAYTFSGIRINGNHMIPEKTLIEINEYNYDTYENRSIISFIKLLLHHIDHKLQQIQKALDLNSKNLSSKYAIYDLYILSSSIIQEYTKIAFQDYIDSLNDIYKQLSKIFVQYQSILKCPVEPLRQAPTPTPVFMGIHHYRNIFSAMYLWFSIGDFEIPQENILLHFSSADKIYEYYCLLNIYDIILSLGFSEDFGKRSNYIYTVNHPKYVNVKEANTFYFSKDGTELTLYYQPVIYSTPSHTDNDISLFRTDKSYFTPDFILKKIKNGITSYAILDAKWRNRRILEDKHTDNGFYDSVYKYKYSIIDKNTLRSAQFFWLLQGKDDYNVKPTYYHHSGRISKTKPLSFQNETGIVRFTPKSGKSELLKILDTFAS